MDLRLNDAGRVFVDRGSKTDSDEIIAEIEVSKDAHVTLFEVTTDTLKVLWPNSLTKRYSMEPFVPADTIVEFPPPRLRNFGFRFRAQVPAGRERVTRRLVVVATKEDVPFREVLAYEVEEDRTLKVRKTSIQALNRWLVKIPLGQRAIQSVTYDVTRGAGW